jgi:hypothetical protein
MLDATPQTAGSWLEQNFWHVVQFVGMVAMIVASFVTLRERVKDNTRDIGRLDIRVEGVEKDVDAHCDDRAIHWDPVRDERRMQKIEKLVEEIHAEVRGKTHHGGDRA